MNLKAFKGKWKIVNMEQWAVEDGWYIEFDGKGRGDLHFHQGERTNFTAVQAKSVKNENINYMKDSSENWYIIE